MVLGRTRGGAASRIGTRGDPFEPIDLTEVLDGVLAALQVRLEENETGISVEPHPRVEGESDEGSVFSVTLPATERGARIAGLGSGNGCGTRWATFSKQGAESRSSTTG